MTKLYQQEEWLNQRVREGRSPAEIALMCEVTEQTIERWLERNDISPYRDNEWLEEQVNQYVSERAIAEWCNVTEQTVKRWMRKYDIEHPGLTPVNVMESFLEQRLDNREEIPKNTQIKMLWQRHQIRVQYADIAKAVGTSPSYVRKVVGAGSGGEIGALIDSMEFLGSESVPDDIAAEVKSRDNHRCVRCSSPDRIEIHHIIPGKSKLENLTLLCRDCHEEAHQGDFHTADLAYETRDEFWENWV